MGAKSIRGHRNRMLGVDFEKAKKRICADDIPTTIMVRAPVFFSVLQEHKPRGFICLPPL
jgi:hypothetical protein